MASAYAITDGRAFFTGVEVLAHLMVLQRRRDVAAGLNTAGYVSGYRGSPLGGLDRTFWRWQSVLEENRIHFQPAINEELAATAILGTQQLNLHPGAQREGVFALWYGKGPGLDRAGDALKHANSLGTAPLGGALVVVGDDHGAVSSSMAHQCEQVMASWMMPVLHPSSIREYLEFGLLGFALSRYSGCYIGFKAVSSIVETAATVDLDAGGLAIDEPDDFVMPDGGVHIRWPDPQLAQETRLQQVKIPAVQAFARANRIDRTVWSSPGARYGIVTTGKAHTDLMQALAELGIDARQAELLGMRIYKVGMPWPLEPVGAKEFAQGLDQVLVVEEKRPFVESQLKELLYELPDAERPKILGKRGLDGAPLLPSTGELDAALIARVLADWLPLDSHTGEVSRYLSVVSEKQAECAQLPKIARPPYFCAGCPHNVSTRVPEGSRALAGTGCHLMAVGMKRDTSSLLHMGGEGVNWVGQAPFTGEKHIFQNLGDGTYVHSGHLAIRQAVAAGVNITYKILYNDAVAMTGGQPLEGTPSVAEICHQIYHEGVKRIAVISEDLETLRKRDYPSIVTFHTRGDLDELQNELRRCPDVSALVYDWTCATERRRRRKRGEWAPPVRRAFINTAVCEGCGDCVTTSNCIALLPEPTPLGWRRRIDQSACNDDMACLDAYCPAIVTLEGAGLRGRVSSNDLLSTVIPRPDTAADGDICNVLLAGAGGSGIVTVGRILGMAAHLEGKANSVLDFTGLAQKGGQVLTHVRIAPDYDRLNGSRIPTAGAHLLLAGDAISASAAEALGSVLAGQTTAVVNSWTAPSSANVLDPKSKPVSATTFTALETALAGTAIHRLDATARANQVTGESMGANLVLLGYAYQLGRIPLALASIREAIRRNRVAVEGNLLSFHAGRLAVHDPGLLEALCGDTVEDRGEGGLDALTQRHYAYLCDYQNQRYANRYIRLVDSAVVAEKALIGKSGALSDAVARSYFRLLAYKDEYEVARLHVDRAFREALEAQFSGRISPEYHLAVPFLPGRDPRTGGHRKRSFGPWLRWGLKVLSKTRFLRGTVFDIFGYQKERRVERQLIAEFESDTKTVLSVLSAENYDMAVEFVRLPQEISGFGPVKMRSVKSTAEQRQVLRADLFGERSPSRKSPHVVADDLVFGNH